MTQTTLLLERAAKTGILLELITSIEAGQQPSDRSQKWLQDLNDSIMLCEICGRPHFALNPRSTVNPACGNTCIQQRRRGTKSPGLWMRMINPRANIDFSNPPRTVADLKSDPRLEVLKPKMAGTLAELVIDLDDKPTVIESDDSKVVPVDVTPAPEPAPQTVIDFDDIRPDPVKAVEYAQKVRSIAQTLRDQGKEVKASDLFPRTKEGLLLWRACVEVFGITQRKDGTKGKTTPTKAGEVLRIGGAQMRNRERRILATLNGVAQK